MTSVLALLLAVAFALALVPAVWFQANLREYRPPPAPTSAPAPNPASHLAPATNRPRASVLIPARDEAHAIGSALAAVLANRGVELEVMVLDDHSQDATLGIVAAIAAVDQRVQVVRAPELPPGWCGKQYACWILAKLAKLPVFVFVDADVRLAPDAIERMVAFLERSGAELASGIPRQETAVFLERLLIPLIHFILLGFLPLAHMRRSAHPGFAAGCGQLFITRREAYELAGGRAAIRSSLHDGLKLPRAYRLRGLQTDLFDGTDIASCRMYHSARAVWHGLAKNAGEGLASPGMIVPMTLVLAGGQVLPFVLLGLGVASFRGAWSLTNLAVAGAAVALAYYPRLVAVRRFRQPLAGTLLQPAGVVILLAIQWYAFARHLLGRPAVWRGRLYPAEPAHAHVETPTPGHEPRRRRRRSTSA